MFSSLVSLRPSSLFPARLRHFTHNLSSRSIISCSSTYYRSLSSVTVDPKARLSDGDRLSPLVVSAPMRPISKHELATSVSLAGGLGFLANTASVDEEMKAAQRVFASAGRPTEPTLPIGLGWQCYQESLDAAASTVATYLPTAAWLFATSESGPDLLEWARTLRDASEGKTQIWAQIGTVTEAVSIAEQYPDVTLVLQGSDSGGHGLSRAASLMSLIPETIDALTARGLSHVPVVAAGGIADARGAAAAMVLGAHAIAMGTRFLMSHEADAHPDFKRHLLATSDGGASTVRTRLFDDLRGTSDFPSAYDGRALVNASVDDADRGMGMEENTGLYQKAVKKDGKGYGPDGRLVSYSGTAVGLVKDLKPAGQIVEEVRSGIKEILHYS